MVERVSSSMSELLREKFRYLHPYIMGGQAERMWTSSAPQPYRKSMVSRSWVPRTMESSTNRSFFPSISSGTGICFIFATWLRTSWLEGMKERGQVGVYFTKGRAKNLPLRLA